MTPTGPPRPPPGAGRARPAGGERPLAPRSGGGGFPLARAAAGGERPARRPGDGSLAPRASAGGGRSRPATRRWSGSLADGRGGDRPACPAARVVGIGPPRPSASSRPAAGGDAAAAPAGTEHAVGGGRAGRPGGPGTGARSRRVAPGCARLRVGGSRGDAPGCVRRRDGIRRTGTGAGGEPGRRRSARDDQNHGGAAVDVGGVDQARRDRDRQPPRARAFGGGPGGGAARTPGGEAGGRRAERASERRGWPGRPRPGCGTDAQRGSGGRWPGGGGVGPTQQGVEWSWTWVQAGG